MAGRRDEGPVRGFLSALGTLLMVVILVVVLVSSGGWETLSRATGIGNPEATVGDLTALKPGGSTATPKTGGQGDNANPTPPQAETAPKTETRQPQVDAAPKTEKTPSTPQRVAKYDEALKQLDSIKVAKARQGGYDRENQFGGWASDGCKTATTRDLILARDLKDVVKKDGCKVSSGTLHDPYTGKTIRFTRGRSTSAAVQIDHVVALQDAWASGARDWPQSKRVKYANSPDVLLAADGPANMAKGAGLDFNGTGRWITQKSGAPDVWMPDNTAYRCDYMAKRVDIKADWGLSMTSREKQQTVTVMASCAAGTYGKDSK